MTEFIKELHTIFYNCLYGDQTTRPQAEQALNQRRHDTANFIYQSILYSNASLNKQNGPLRLLALTQVNNTLIKIEHIRSIMTDQMIEELCQKFIENCSVEDEPKIVTILSAVISTFSFMIEQEGYPWKNLISVMMNMTNEQNVIQQCIALDVLGKITTHPEAIILHNHVGEMKNYLAKCFVSDHFELKMKAMNFLANAIGFLEKTQEGQKMNELYPVIMQNLQQAIQTNNNDFAISLLNDLNEIAGFSHHFFSSILKQVSENLMTLCTSNIDNELTQSAMEIFLVLIENYTSQFKKSGFLPNILVVLLNWLASICDDDIDDWINEETEETLFEYAEDSLELLTNLVGGKPLRETLFAKCGEYLVKNEWNYRYAALTAFKSVTQHGKFIMKGNIAELMQKGFAAVSDNHPVVAYALLNLLEELLDNFPHIMMRNHCDTVFNAIILCMKSNVARLQERACCTLQSLLEILYETPNKLLPALNGLMEALFTIITNSNKTNAISVALTSLVHISLFLLVFCDFEASNLTIHL